MENKEKNNSSEKKKLFVVGWTRYNDEYFPPCKVTEEVREAIVAEVREKGYLFGGDSHQDNFYNCTPVLSNGCRALFSWRAWGLVIAMAYNLRGKDGNYDHLCGYMNDMLNPDEIRKPEPGIDFSLIEDKGKTYELELSSSQRDNLYHKDYEARPNSEELKQIKIGDYLNMFVYDEEKRKCTVWETPCKVVAILHYKNFEELVKYLPNDYFHSSERFGYLENLSKEQLVEQLYKDYPREQVEKQGVVVFKAIEYYNY